ncbi:IS701 family transposase [Streptomyces sp. NPDC047841]|uniref:IS701 family transposase n=1 Tax=Streptomyces sp. NPDC047841 TaxID=3154708 RepID=UPI003455E451
MIDERAVEIWNDELEELFLRTGHRFRRIEPRRRMRNYIRGLLGPVGRKNGWQLAEYVGHRTPDCLQRLLNGARWDADDLRDDLQHHVAERLDEPDGILILDDTGFLKKGTAGRSEHCQIGVFAAYATTRGRALVERELFLPKHWTDDRDRCRAAHIPGERTFATKPELAKAMVLRAIASPLPIAWVTADAAYGQEWRLRRMLEETGLPHVLAVPESQQVLHFARGDGAKRASTTGPPCRPPPSRTSTARCPPTSGGHWHAAASASPRRSPTTLPTPARHHGRAPVPRRRDALGHQGSPPDREERVRPRPVRSPPLHRLDAAHSPGHIGTCLPGRHGRRRRGKRGSRNGSCLAPLIVAEVRRLLATGQSPAPFTSPSSAHAH